MSKQKTETVTLEAVNVTCKELPEGSTIQRVYGIDFEQVGKPPEFKNGKWSEDKRKLVAKDVPLELCEALIEAGLVEKV